MVIKVSEPTCAADADFAEMLDSDRLRGAHVPGGYSPRGVQSHAMQGHAFGLKVNAMEREQLMAFLRTL
jgi:hypothetical protein